MLIITRVSLGYHSNTNRFSFTDTIKMAHILGASYYSNTGERPGNNRSKRVSASA